jgi:hypothetical protein
MVDMAIDKLGNQRTCQLVSLEMPDTTILMPGGLRARTGALGNHEYFFKYYLPMI